MDILDAVKKLRFKTSAGMMECKEALKESGGDIEKAVDILRKKGIAKAAKKTTRIAEINCETDFVARTDDFKKFTKDITMQIAAANPLYVTRDEIPEEAIEREKDIARSQMKDKPDNVVEKILSGKLEKYFSEVCLIDQPFIKDPNLKIKDLLTQIIATLGENILIKRFVRYEIGEEV